MNDYSQFDDETRELFERLDRSIASYHAQVEKDWRQKKEPTDTPKKQPTDPYTRRREIFQSCRKTTPGGGAYFHLGEYYEKLNGL